MPYADTIMAVALGLLGVAMLWVLASSIGCTPRAIRIRRAAKTRGGEAFLCGACGHPATTLGRVRVCPECGAEYARVGLDAPGTSVRWAMPPVVLLLLLLGRSALGMLHASPIAARWANERAIDSGELEHWRSRAVMSSGLYDPATGTQPGLVVEIDRDFVGPAFTPPGATRREPLAGTLTARFTYNTLPGGFHGAWASHSIQRQGVAQARRNSLNNPPPPAYPGPAALATPWDQQHTTAPTLTLRWRVGREDWTLTAGRGAVVESGNGISGGVHAAFDRTGLLRDADGLTDVGEMVLAGIDGALQGKHAMRMRRYIPSEHGYARIEGMYVFGEVTATPARLSIHPASPWGVAAAVAVPAALLLVSLIMVWFAVRARTRAMRPTRARPPSRPVDRD
ncbi:MAG: hypothetical protein ACFCBV_14245 [Phycisphaerales bacterium]